MLTLMLATALAAAPAPTPMPCAGCSPQAMADCPMGPAAMARSSRPESGPVAPHHAERH